MKYLEPHVQRAWMLLQQNRPELAEKELRQALLQRPDNGTTHALLAMALSQLNRHQEANESAEAAIGLSPDDDFSHYVHSRVLTEARCFPEAEAAVKRAIELDSNSASYFAQLASIYLQAKRWQDVLQVAEQGLEIDPDNDACANLRAMALTSLGRKTEAAANLQSALERDPEDAWTHTNLGWTLLESGQHTKALEHFREALRLEPDFEYARLGIITAMKARSILYRPLLWYFLWVQKLQATYAWAFIIGFFFLMNFVSKLGEANPALAPFVMPIMVVYILFVYSTWLGNALFNLVLYTDRFGRLVLSEDEKKTSLWVGVDLLLTLAFFIGSFYIPILSITTISFMLAALPLSLVYHAEAGWPRWAIGGMVGLLITLGSFPAFCFALSFFDLFPKFAEKQAVLAIFGIDASLTYIAIGTQILSQVIVSHQPRRINPRRF